MTAPTIPTTLEERITTRLHESIGDLITDGDLKGMVSRGIETALFAGRKIEKRRDWGGGSDTWDKPSVVEEAVQTLLATKMREAVDAWLAANPEKIQAAVDATVKSGVGNALMYALDQRFAGVFNAGVESLQNRGLLPR